MVRRKFKLPDGAVVGVQATTDSAVARVYEKRLAEMRQGSAIFPLTAPGLPPFPANSAFLDHVQALGDKESRIVTEVTKGETGKKVTTQSLVYSDQLSRLVQSALRERNFSLPVEVGPHRTKDASFVPGHLWGFEAETGPRQADVMIISKNPWVPEVQEGRCFAGDDGKLLREMFVKFKAKRLGRFYVTHLVKFMPPDWKTTLKAVWVKDCLHLLYQEIKIVQPRYILCLGSDVSKALLGGTAGVTEMEGRVETFQYNAALSAKDGDAYLREARVMTVIHPRQVIRDQSAIRQLENGVARFVALLDNVDIGAIEEVDHREVHDHGELLQTLIEVEEQLQENVIAVDAEWHGQHPINAGSYLRTIQFAWAPKHAVGIKLQEPGGEVVEGFRGESVNHRGIRTQTIELLNVFFKGGQLELGDGRSVTFRRKRVVGHFFNADLEWLVQYGINIQDCFLAPLRDYELTEANRETARHRLYRKDGYRLGEAVPAWYRTKYEGGADTGLMAHAIEETASYKLETLAMRYTSAPRYDKALQDWRTQYCKEQGIKSGSIEGYGMCPDEVLLPYGMYDADVTLRLFYKFSDLLDEDYDGNNCREAFWESQIAAPAVLEIHRSGILVDRGRIDFLTARFVEARTKLEDQLRKEIKWPDFNIRSTQHVKELLFGHRLNGKLDKKTGEVVRQRPPDAISLGLMPLFDTGKPPKPWIEIVRRHKEHEHSPSTNKQVLSLMAQQAPNEKAARLINSLRDYRFLDQVLKTVLRPPSKDKDTEEAVVDDDGNWEYEDGLASMVCDDGKVRTHIYQTKETGRWSSARPNLQNISKQRDPDYKRLLGEEYKYSLRSVLKASPGHVLVEADYVGAELFGMAVMSGDPNMIEHATRNQLPEDHPNYYDIHSNVAVSAFRLTCPPTKSGLASIGKKHIRIVAKSVIFGIAYGRGAKAIAVAAKEQGIDVNVEEAQAVIDAIFRMYPHLRPFFLECQARATGQYRDPRTDEMVTARYLCNCYGRFRRFPDSSNDEALAAEFSRQAMNFPIQSMIASAMSRALAYIYDYKAKQLAKGREVFRILLQIHDAILLEVPDRYVKHVCEHVLPVYMRKAVPIYPTDLDGIPTGRGPFYLGIEAEVMDHWGEVLSFDQATARGLPTGHGGAEGCVVNYSRLGEAKPQRSVVLASKRRPAVDLDIPPYKPKKKRKR
jgi:uracil-DNA glycosylase family 4